MTDADSGEFVRVLDMKGLRKVDQAVYIENFNSLQPNPTGSQQIQPASSPSAKSNIEEEESRIRKLEKMIRKKLWFVNKRNELCRIKGDFSYFLLIWSQPLVSVCWNDSKSCHVSFWIN